MSDKPRLTVEESRKYLKDHGFIQLPPGSYFNWIQADRFSLYKSVLSFKNGAWIPSMNKLTELGQLDRTFKEKDWKEYGAEIKEKEIADSLVQTETYENAKGETLPF